MGEEASFFFEGEKKLLFGFYFPLPIIRRIENQQENGTSKYQILVVKSPLLKTKLFQTFFFFFCKKRRKCLKTAKSVFQPVSVAHALKSWSK